MKKKILRLIIILVVVISVFFVLSELSHAQSGQEDQGLLSGWMQEMMLEPYLPAIRMMRSGSADKSTSNLYDGWILAEYPVLLYSVQEEREDAVERAITRVFSCWRAATRSAKRSRRTGWSTMRMPCTWSRG